MLKQVVLILIVLLVCCTPVIAQQSDKEKNPRIVILLDGSSSMLKEWTKDKIRFEAAASIIDRLMDSVYAVNKDVEFALRVYGHQSPTVANNCFDSKLEVMFSRDNYTQMMLRLAALHPLGISPIAYSIQQAAEKDMTSPLDNKYSLILITDGGESCDGDICKIAELLLKKKIDFKPYIISLADYAPLKLQYDCLGEYLLVTKPGDIEPVVGKIVESYRHTFIQPVVNAKMIEVARKTPSVLKVRTPDVKLSIPEPEPETKIQQAAPPVVTPPPVKKAPEVVKAPEPKKDTVVTKPLQAALPEPAKPARQSSIVVINELKDRKKVPAVFLATKRKHTLPVIYTSRNLQYVALPKIVMPPPEAAPERPKDPVYKPMQTATMVKNPVTQPKQPEPQLAEYKVIREEAAETILEVYFTDGKGKFYQTAPEIVLRDMKTNEPVHKFDRDVDFSGKPRPQKNIKPGTYNVTVTGKDGMVWQAMEVRANTRTRFDLVVSKGSLAFTYATNPSRPVKEFSARVSVALKRNVVNKQECTEVIPYEPENYHVEINTNPISHRNVDLDFGVLVNLMLDEPGQIKVINNGGYRNIQFLYQHGDQYETFNPLNVKGDINQQEFLIQPGRYKIAYIKNAQVANPKPEIKDFIIKSNTVTELILD